MNAGASDRRAFLAERRAISVQRFDTVHSPRYDALWGAIGGTHADFIARLAGLVRAGGEVLDAACGTGKHWPALLAAGVRVTGIDQSAGMLARASRKHPDVTVRVLAHRPCQSAASCRSCMHYNDDQVTNNAVFTWAPWPVAMAFGARATARRRGLVLHVRQRPSYGAGGPRQYLRLTDGAHDFLRDKKGPPAADAAPDHKIEVEQRLLSVTLAAMADDSNRRTPQPPAGAAVTGNRTAPGALPGIVLLAVRLVDEPIGDPPLDAPNTREVSIRVSASLAGTMIQLGKGRIPFAQWRLTSAASPAPQVPWPAFPSLAETIADWVTEQASANPGHVVLLAARIPQELAVGLGIRLGQRTRTWPGRMYPVYFSGGRLIVPDLRLGAESVPTERA